MFLNVWLVIWPKQQIVLASATAVAGGGAPDPAAGAAAGRAFLASRVNLLFSVPMLFFMGAASHLTTLGAGGKHMTLGLVAVVALGIEALALTGTKGEGAVKLFDVHVNVLWAGIALTAVCAGAFALM
jgi:uncharacterized membrane protein